jgi:hypothetical protein
MTPTDFLCGALLLRMLGKSLYVVNNSDISHILVHGVVLNWLSTRTLPFTFMYYWRTIC